MGRVVRFLPARSGTFWIIRCAIPRLWRGRWRPFSLTVTWRRKRLAALIVKALDPLVEGFGWRLFGY